VASASRHRNQCPLLSEQARFALRAMHAKLRRAQFDVPPDNLDTLDAAKSPTRFIEHFAGQPANRPAIAPSSVAGMVLRAP
jgi:hypothetical protein